MASQVAHNVLIETFQDRSKLTKPDEIIFYLYRRLNEVCAEKTKLPRQNIPEGTEILDGTGNSESTSNVTDFATQRCLKELRSIQKRLRGLSEEQAAAVRLKVLDDLTMDEIARVMNTTRSSVRMYLHDGLVKVCKKTLAKNVEAS